MKDIYLRNRLCIPVKGFNRSVIIDLVRKDYFFIPNNLYQLIKTNQIIDFYQIKDIEEWKRFLINEEIIFKIDNPDETKLFPEVSHKFEPPLKLSHVIIHSNL